jgi:hypothetical protein
MIRRLCPVFRPARPLWAVLALLAVLPLATLAPAPRAALAASASQEDLVRLAEVSGGTQMAAEMFGLMQQQMVVTLRKQHPDLPDYVFTTVQEEFQREQGAFVRAVAVAVGQVWGRYLSAGEVREMIELYQRPVMRKAVGLIPQVMRDSQQVGAKVGMDMAGRVLPRILQRLKDEHGLDLRTKQ